MSNRLNRVHASRSAAMKAGLNHLVIDPDVHVNDCAPVLEDYVAQYGRSKLVNALGSRFATRHGGGKNWYKQTAEERS
jgi:hypothetical protein